MFFTSRMLSLLIRTQFAVNFPLVVFLKNKNRISFLSKKRLFLQIKNKTFNIVKVMKKSLFIFVAGLISFNIANGQSIELIHDGEVKNDNDTIIVSLSANMFSKQYVDIANTTQNDINLKIRGEIISKVANTDISFCFGNCVELGETATEVGPVTAPAEDTLSYLQGFYTEYVPNGNAGTSIVKYTFFNDDNQTESQTIFFKFVTDNVSICENMQTISSSINTFPNPANDIITILSASADIQKVELFNLQGQLIKTEQLYNNTMNISHLPAGMYSLRITTEKGIAVKNIIKK